MNPNEEPKEWGPKLSRLWLSLLASTENCITFYMHPRMSRFYSVTSDAKCANLQVQQVHTCKYLQDVVLHHFPVQGRKCPGVQTGNGPPGDSASHLVLMLKIQGHLKTQGAHRPCMTRQPVPLAMRHPMHVVSFERQNVDTSIFAFPHRVTWIYLREWYAICVHLYCGSMRSPSKPRRQCLCRKTTKDCRSHQIKVTCV